MFSNSMGSAWCIASHDSEIEYVPSCPAATNGPIPDHPGLVRQRPTDDVVESIRIREHGGERMDSPAVILVTFVCKLMITGAPSTGVASELSPVSPVGVGPVESLDSSDSEVSPLGSELGLMVAVMGTVVTVRVVVGDCSSPPQATRIQESMSCR
jgi:hypothetical protein